MKLVAWILQIFGGYIMFGYFFATVYVLTSQIEEGEVIPGILALVIVFFMIAYPGYRLFRKGRNMLKKPENIKESDNSELNEMEQTEVDEDDKTLIDHLSLKEVVATFPPRVVSCKGCGANNIIQSDKAQCEYCGGYLT